MARIGWVLLAALSLFTAVQAATYLAAAPEGFAPTFRDKYVAHLPWVMLHGGSSLVALALVPLQLADGFRHRHVRLHRVAGVLFLAGVLVGGVTGFRLGTIAFGGPMARVAYCAAAIGWVTTGLLGALSIIRHDVRGHRRWMARCCALAFGAVVLRLALAALVLAGGDPHAWDAALPWIAWVPCIATCEVLVRGRGGRWAAGLVVAPPSRREIHATQ